MNAAGATVDLFPATRIRRVVGTGRGTGQAAGFDLFPSVFPTCSGLVPMRRNRSEQVSDLPLNTPPVPVVPAPIGAEPEQVAVGRSGEQPWPPRVGADV